MNTLPFLQLCKPSLQPPLQLTAFSRMILSLANRFYPFSMKTLKYTNTIKRYRNIAKADGLTRDVPYFIHVMHRNTEYNRRDSNAEYDSSRCSVWPEYNGRDLNGKFDLSRCIVWSWCPVIIFKLIYWCLLWVQVDLGKKRCIM